jgi:hypothetical protein
VWSATNPHELKATPLHDQKYGAWRPISPSRIIGLLFLDDTINSERYYEVIIYHLIGHLNEDKLAPSTRNRTVLLHTHSSFLHDETA